MCSQCVMCTLSNVPHHMGDMQFKISRCNVSNFKFCLCFSLRLSIAQNLNSRSCSAARHGHIKCSMARARTAQIVQLGENFVCLRPVYVQCGVVKRHPHRKPLRCRSHGVAHLQRTLCQLYKAVTLMLHGPWIRSCDFARTTLTR